MPNKKKENMTQINHQELDKKTTDELNKFTEALLEAVIEQMPKNEEYSRINLIINVFTICLVKIGHRTIPPEYRKQYADGIYNNLIMNFESCKDK